MLNTRVRAELVFAAIVIAFMIFADPIPFVLTCTAPPPMPLRALYKESERIVVARVGSSRVVSANDNYLVVRTALHVSSTVKGKDEPVIFLEHWASNDPLVSRDFSNGDTVLAFLTRAEDDGVYEIIDASYGLKKLSDPDLKVYLQRISELAKIMESEKRDPADLVEWLVRCAEERATRWEGAYELNLSASMLYADPTDSEEDAADPTDGEEPEEAGEVGQSETTSSEIQAEVDEEENLVSSFAALLTESQRTRLVGALVAEESVGENDSLLIELVSHWNDPRLVPFLVSQLRRETTYPTYLTEQMMDVVAEVLGDKQLRSLSGKYSELGSDRMGTEDEQVAPPDNAAASNGAAATEKRAVLEKFLVRAEKISKQ